MLKNEVEELISMKQEGPYWDFKREWPTENGDLLHDIICMANNLENRDAYIIIGIDEEKDFTPTDIIHDNHRKSTQNIIDFLKDKAFAGGIRPQVYIETIMIESYELDVIIIKNSHDTPFYLTQRYKKVNPNHIYTRVMDTNTPPNNSADIHFVEYLWKKRFRLISPPLDRVKYYLMKPDDWIKSPSDWETVKKYHKQFPEFSIEYTLDDNGNGYQYYLFNQTDTTPHWREIRISYHQTQLFSTEGVSLDGGRYFTPTPFTDGISIENPHKWDVMFKYFINDSIEYIIHKFYYEPDGDEADTAHRRFNECILLFSNEEEKELFKHYVIYRWHEKHHFSKDIWTPYFPQIEGLIMESFKKDYINVQILKRMFEHFKHRNT